MDRRIFILAAASVPGLLVVRGSRVNIAPEVVDEFERITRRLTDSYARAPIPATAQAVRRELPTAHAILSEGTLTAQSQRRMHAVTGRLGALLGNTSLDSGFPGPAARRLAQASVHSRLGEDPTNEAWIRLLQSSIELHDDRPKEALAYARDGHRRAPGGSPVAARLAAEGIGWSLAKLGDRRGAAEALDAAWRTVDAFTPTQRGVPGWHPDHLNPAELDSITAAVYLDAGNPHAALLHTETGISRLDSSPATGHRAYVRVDAAIAMFERDEIEPAFTYAHEALRVSRDRKLTEVGDCIARFITRATDRGAPRGLVDDLDVHLREWQAPPDAEL